MRNSNKPNDSTILHSWELAVLPRRVRASLANKIGDAFDGMVNGRNERHFAFLNPITQCWDVFYFQYGGDKKEFQEKAKELTRMKIYIERRQGDFQFSVFCFAFRKSQVFTNNTFDNVVLHIEDAQNYQRVSDDVYDDAKKYFAGITSTNKVYEFPSN